MFGWGNSGNGRPERRSPLQTAEKFIAEYANSDQKDLYAMELWGITEAFRKIFVDLDGYHAENDEKKKKYLNLLGTSAIEELRKGDQIAASSNNFFMNYLVATNGMSRASFRGPLEQVSDILDGIVSLGAAKMDQLARVEEAAQEVIRSEGHFQIGSGVIAGPMTERAVVEVSNILMSDLNQILRTGDDFYWFLVEQHDRLLSQPSAIRNMLDGLPLFSVEYKGKRSVESYVGKANPGTEYLERIRPQILSWCAYTVPNLDPGELSTRVIAAAYGHFRNAHQNILDQLRLEMARQFQANSLANGDPHSASRWEEVITALS